VTVDYREFGSLIHGFASLWWRQRDRRGGINLCAAGHLLDIIAAGTLSRGSQTQEECPLRLESGRPQAQPGDRIGDSIVVIFAVVLVATRDVQREKPASGESKSIRVVEQAREQEGTSDPKACCRCTRTLCPACGNFRSSSVRP
jgi:hypothetical protein